MLRIVLLTLLLKQKKMLSIPIVGIGGITFNNAQQVFNAGANAVAMINGLTE